MLEKEKNLTFDLDLRVLPGLQYQALPRSGVIYLELTFQKNPLTYSKVTKHMSCSCHFGDGQDEYSENCS